MDSKINILWVTNTLGYGGAQKQILYMYDIMQRNIDFNITILYYTKMQEELTFEGVRTVFIDKQRLGKKKTIQAIAEYVKENNVHIMHAFGGGSANIYGRFAAMRVKDVVPVGAMLGKKHFKSLAYKVLNSYLNLFGNWWTVNNLELVPILKRDLKFVNTEHVVMLHNGFMPASKVDYHRDELTEYDQDKGNSFIFAVVGRLQPVKNYPLFLKAAAEVLKKHANVRFWVVGDGDDRDKLENLAAELGIAEKVRFWGFRNDIDTALARMDAFVQTSFTEGSPNTIAEAMRASLPVISTRSTDLSEMVHTDVNGYEIENDSYTQLTESMIKLVEMSPEKRSEFGKESYRLFEQYFLDDIVAKEFDDFYKMILRGKINV